MDTIGIKLADGTFYPILEDGKPEKKNISLTTVKDNQTIVHVDLFRSPTGTMQDAQYIDTLEIDNLNPHTNGEPSLNFDIELGEDGSLSAAIDDPETGTQASRQVSLSALAGIVSEKKPAHDSDLSLKDSDADAIEEPIELGKRQDRSAAARPARDDLKDMEDIFKAPEKKAPEKDTKADSSFDEIVNDISNIGKDPDALEADGGSAPDSEAFSFDDFGDAGTKQDEVADEPLEEIPAGKALPQDAEFVDSTGDELVDTIGVLDASLDQPDFGFKALADEDGQQSPEDAVFAETDGDTERESELAAADGDTETETDAETESEPAAEAEAVAEAAGIAGDAADRADPERETAAAEAEDEASEGEPVPEDAGQEPESGEFEDLGTLPDWSTGGLEDVDDDSDLRSLPAFADDAADGDKNGSADLYPPAETSGVSDVLSEEPASADDDFGDLDLPSLNIFEEQEAVPSPDLTRSSLADDTADMTDAAAGGDSAAGASAADSDAWGDDFELPDLDFDDAVKEEADVDFSMPDFDSPSSGSAFDDFDATLSSTADDWPSLDMDSTKSSGSSSSSYMPSNMFDDLYDKETMEGKSSDGYEDDRNTTRVPMFVCIACAVICILCLFFLFVIPTQFNVLRRSNTQEISFHEQRGLPDRPEGKLAVGGTGASGAKESDAAAAGQDSGRGQSSAGELIKPASPASVSAPLPKVESVPAKENEIVIAAVPSHVVPETPVRNVKKIPDIQYTVVWGDTLWDIASAYYKNPWKYTELAEYNHLKNPNFIQTGSTLLIPAE